MVTPEHDLDLFQPRPAGSSSGYWASLRSGVLSARRCRACATWLHPPLECCRLCGGRTEFEPLSGLGTIYSFTVTRYRVTPLYEPPIIVAVVELAEQLGLRMVGRVIGVEPDAVRIGMEVQVDIIDLPGGDDKVAAFRPRSSAGSGT